MRQHKFRAWDGKRMLAWDEIGDEPGDLQVTMIANVFADESLTFLEWTGLTDKHGVEIYEGDIVETIESGVSARWASREKVFWDEKYLGFAPFCYPRFVNSNEVVTVLGNIYENPELLIMDKVNPKNG